MPKQLLHSERKTEICSVDTIGTGLSGSSSLTSSEHLLEGALDRKIGEISLAEHVGQMAGIVAKIPNMASMMDP